MATEKKKSAQREDKELAGSVDTGNSSADASASLHARRAKLRGALGSKSSSFSNEPSAVTPAPHNADPYGSQSDPYVTQPDPFAAQPAPFAAQPDPFASQPDPFASQPDPFAAQPDPFAAQPDPFATQPDPFATQPDPFATQPDPFATQPDPFATQPDPFATQPDPFAAQPDPFAAQPAPFAAQPAPFASQPAPFASQPAPFATQPDPFASQPDHFAAQTAPFASQPDHFASQPDHFASQPDHFASPLQRHAMAPNSITNTEHVNKPSLDETPVNVYGVPITAETQSTPAAKPEIIAPQAPEPRRSRRNSSTSANTSSQVEAAPIMPPSSQAKLTALPQAPDKTTELVNSIDQSLNVCATNLAALQNLAGEQTEVLKGLSQTLQNQTLLEIGLNLNSLTESLTAALEPMKSIGELIPALDSLVSTLENREQDQSDKMSPEQLVTSLSDQLSAGLIDPWTFKCAYMAVYPADLPADLLHRLVELLGSQRLSGDLFRAAYEAVQAAEPPLRSSYNSSASIGEFRGSLDESIRIQLDNLEKANRELQRRQEEREEELLQLLSTKENELQAAHDQLNQRLEELNSRYADAADMISAREEEFRATLESKDMDIIEKDAELNMLRAQMEELRFSTEELGKELHREMQELKVAAQQASNSAALAAANSESTGAAAVNSQGFFDPSPHGNRTSSGLFDTAPASSKASFVSDNGGFQDSAYAGDFGTENATFSPPQSSVQQSFQTPQNPSFQAPQAPSFQAPQTPVFQPPQQAPAQQQASGARMGSGQSSSTTPFGGQSGSYGMGVRQQVFEVIVRQALAGAPWREICAGPMQVNNISQDEVESEVKRRQSLLNK